MLDSQLAHPAAPFPRDTCCGDLNFNTKLVKATFVPVVMVGRVLP
jgi:hypothetical protein